MEEEGVTLDTNPKKEMESKIVDILVSTFLYGILTGLIFCISVFGLGQQIFENYQSLFYSDNFYSTLRHIWMSVDWKIWVGTIFCSFIYGRYCYSTVKWRMLNLLNRGNIENRRDN